MTDTQRGAPGDCQIIRVPNLLKPKVGEGPTRLPDAVARYLDGQIEKERHTYLPILDDEIADLRKLIGEYADRDSLDERGNRALYYIAHRIRGEAGMNREMLVGSIANLLCECLDHPDTVSGPLIQFVALHVDAIAAARAADFSEDGASQARQVIEAFKAARAKLMTGA